MTRAVALACAFGLALGCSSPEELPVYRAVPIEPRDIRVGAEAAGLVEPQITVEVKSKASGEILELTVDSGDRVAEGTLLVRIDQRQPRNALGLARAELEVAQARLGIADEQRKRAERLFKASSIPETQLEQARLESANAQAEVVRARVALENAQIQMDDTLVNAPISGTVIEKNVERGQVISSPTQDVSGGTILLKMADLTTVQVRTLVDETDIGKMQPGMTARVSVSAHPGTTFVGRVTKIEPQAVVEQNVTMFPVRVELENPEGLLRPGMNASVEVRVAEQEQTLAVPNAALVAPRDVELMARVVGAEPPAARQRSVETPSGGEARARTSRPPRGGGGEELPSDSTAVPTREQVVFVLRPSGPELARIVTGITDLDYSQVVSGLVAGDQVLLLPSAEMIRSQERFQQRIEGLTGGGLPGMRSSRR